MAPCDVVCTRPNFRSKLLPPSSAQYKKCKRQKMCIYYTVGGQDMWLQQQKFKEYQSDRRIKATNYRLGRHVGPMDTTDSLITQLCANLKLNGCPPTSVTGSTWRFRAIIQNNSVPVWSWLLPNIFYLHV